ncbi:MAG: AAA family ATPase [Candidatus Nomurabacteria bacterium]|nr:MAG: AAA family ATPase [Candidatus Nomurabacteria bacterium]
MYLQKLEIQGFKSFAKKVDFDFTRGIAAIVGPNGSGKSNVADAVRWVMGEQSMKVLRGKRADDVIFSGSDKKGRLGMAEVSLVFNNEDGTMPIDFAEVAITRRVYRNGEGEYFVNKQPARLADIILMLAKSNVGQKAYSVIGQGMIDQVLIATPQERKTFFDEAAGVRQFQIKREQAENKLKATRSNLAQAELLMQEVEPRLRTLTRQVRRLERRQEVEQELRALQEAYYSQVWADLSERHATEKKHYDELEAEQHKAAKELEHIQRELEAIEQERGQDDAFRELQQQYSRLLDEKNALMKEQAVLRGRQELEASQQGQYDVVWLKNRKEELERTIKEIDEELEQLSTQLAKEQAHFEQQSLERDKVVQEFESIEAKLVQASSELRNEKSFDAGKFQKTLSTTKAAYEELLSALNSLESLEQLPKLKSQAAKIDADLAEMLDSINQEEKADHSQIVLELQAKLTQFMKTKDSLVNELHALENKTNQLKEKHAALKHYRDRLQGELDKVLRELTRANIKPEDKGKADSLFRKEDAELEKKVNELDERLKALAHDIQGFNKKAQDKRERLFSLQKSFRESQQRLNAENAKLNAIQVELAKLETRRNDLEQEFTAEVESALAEKIKKATSEKIAEVKPVEYYQEEIRRCKHSLELIGGIDEAITQEYETTNERFEFLKKQSDDLQEAMTHLEQVISELDATIKKQFDQSFEKINREFQHYFRVLFQGGKASLVLRKEEVLKKLDDDEEDEDDDDFDEDEDDEEEEQAPKIQPKGELVITGIDINATPPGKKLQNITMLSGGERALTSIALICAIMANNPSPFVFLDEVDAALDEANSQRFANIIAELSNKTQFIVVSHNRATMEKAALLYGVTMGDDGISKVLSVKMEEAEKVIQQHGNRQ